MRHYLGCGLSFSASAQILSHSTRCGWELFKSIVAVRSEREDEEWAVGRDWHLFAMVEVGARW